MNRKLNGRLNPVQVECLWPDNQEISCTHRAFVAPRAIHGSVCRDRFRPPRVLAKILSSLVRLVLVRMGMLHNKAVILAGN